MNIISKFFLILTFIALFVALFVLMYICHPPKKIVKAYYKNPPIDIDTYYFYFQKAAAYRLLYFYYCGCNQIIKVFGLGSVLVVIYCSFMKEDYIILFSLIAAISEALKLMFPFEKNAKVQIKCATIMEYSILNCSPNQNENEIQKALLKAYMKSETLLRQEIL